MKNYFLPLFFVLSVFNVKAQTSGNIGIGTDTPANTLTVKGNQSVGSGYTNITAPVNGSIIEGNVGIGKSAPLANLDVNGQTKLSDGSIAPTAPANGSLLELESNNKGLRMPRIALVNTTSWTPLAGSGAAASSIGMSVYNTNASITSSAVTYPANGAGQYYWDGTGWVKTSSNETQNAEVLFSVKRTTYQAMPASGYTVIDFTAKDYDKNNNFNLSNDTVTIPANAGGFYQINAFFVTTASSISQGAYLGLFVNGVFARYITVGNAAPGAGIASSGTIGVQLNAGDVISFRYQTVNTAQSVMPQIDMFQLSK